MITNIKQNNVFFKKAFLSFITIFSLFIVIGLNSNVSADINNVSAQESIDKNIPFSGGYTGGRWVYRFSADPYDFYRHLGTGIWSMRQSTPTTTHVVNTMINGYFKSYTEKDLAPMVYRR